MGFNPHDEGLYAEKAYIAKGETTDVVRTEALEEKLAIFEQPELPEDDTHVCMKRYHMNSIDVYLEDRGVISVLYAPKDDQTKKRLEQTLGYTLVEVQDRRKEAAKNDPIIKAFGEFARSPAGQDLRVYLLEDTNTKEE